MLYVILTLTLFLCGDYPHIKFSSHVSKTKVCPFITLTCLLAHTLNETGVVIGEWRELATGDWRELETGD